MESKKENEQIMKDLFSQRIWAGLNDQRYPYKYFLGVLPQVGVELDRKVLSQLAIYEPRTFESLKTLCQAKVASAPRGEEDSKIQMPDGVLTKEKL